MTKIVLSDAIQFGIKGSNKRKYKVGKKYQELVCETNKKIDESRFYYAKSYKKALSCLAR